MTTSQESDILTMIRQKLTPQRRRFFDGMNDREKAVLVKSARAYGLDSVVAAWAMIEIDVAEVRTLGGL